MTFSDAGFLGVLMAYTFINTGIAVLTLDPSNSVIKKLWCNSLNI